MSECIHLRGFSAFFLVSIGAITGASLRVWLASILKLFFQTRYLSTLSINLLASFLLGLTYGSYEHCYSNFFITPFALLIVVGFLGSLSTFSTFIFEFYEILFLRKFKHLGLLFLASVLGGLMAIRFGYMLTHDPVN